MLVGYLSDRFGRRRSMIVALLLAVLVIPLWVYSPSVILLAVGAFLMQFMTQGAWGVIPAHLAELSPNSVRAFLPGFAYQCGVLLASSVVYIEAVFAEHMSYSTAMALTGVTVFSLAAIVTALGKERRATVFGTVKEAAVKT
jgi:SHS family lactate transporter-like MFS transporter